MKSASHGDSGEVDHHCEKAGDGEYRDEGNGEDREANRGKEKEKLESEKERDVRIKKYFFFFTIVNSSFTSIFL